MTETSEEKQTWRSSSSLGPQNADHLPSGSVVTDKLGRFQTEEELGFISPLLVTSNTASCYLLSFLFSKIWSAPYYRNVVRKKDKCVPIAL